MIAISDELLSALSTARELADGIRESSTCNVKKVTAAILSPYKGKKVPTVLIGGVSYGIFVGTNRCSWFNCRLVGEDFCPAGRLDPDRPQGSTFSILRRFLCVNKDCAEVQAAKAVLRVIRHPKGAILLSSEVPCARCVDWIVKHPFIRFLFFERMNENRVGDSPFKAVSAYELSDLHALAGVESYHLVSGPKGTRVIPGSTYELPGWTGHYSRPPFPENGRRPVSDSRRWAILLMDVIAQQEALRVDEMVREILHPRRVSGNWRCERCGRSGSFTYRTTIEPAALEALFYESHSEASPDCQKARLIVSLPEANPWLGLDGIHG